MVQKGHPPSKALVLEHFRSKPIVPGRRITHRLGPLAGLDYKSESSPNPTSHPSP